MKKIFAIVLSVLSMTVAAQERIMVLSDPHVLPQSLMDTSSLAFHEMMDSQRKMIDMSEPAFIALVDTALAYHPDLVLIPGDLTKDSEKASHALVVAQLNRLQQAGIPTLLIPGNHDIGGNAYAYLGDQKTPVENLSDAEWETTYSMVYQHVIAKDAQSHSYVAEPLNHVTVLGIDGAHDNAGTGSLSAQTLQWILAQADSARAKGNMMIAMSHWQILEHIDQQGTLESSCRFKEADAIRDSLMHHGVHLILTGHFHVNGITTYHGQQQTDSLVEITTGSPITFPCPYRWLTLSEDRHAIGVLTEFISSLDTVDNMYVYSREWMREHATNMIPQMTILAWKKAENHMDMLDLLMDEDTKAELLGCIPESDSAKIDLVQRHMGSTIVDLYLLHSEANEPEHPEADSLAQALYTGMENMFDEITANTSPYFRFFAVPLLKNFGLGMAEGPVQSLVEDVTQRNTYADRTDDLNGLFFINDGYQAIETVSSEATPHKFIRNGQLIIERGKTKYNVLGQQVNE